MTFVRINSLLGLIFYVISSVNVNAQGTAADYTRAKELSGKFRGLVRNERIEPHWFDQGRQLWYRRDTGDGGRDWIVINTSDGKRSPAFDRERLATAWNNIAQAKHDAWRLPIDRIELNPEHTELRFASGGNIWFVRLSDYQIHREKAGAALAGDRELPSNPGLKASDRRGAESEIRIDNRTDMTVRIFWLDETGERRPYGRVKPGEVSAQHTYAGHVWLVVDRDDQVLGVYRATAEPATAVIRKTEKMPQNPGENDSEKSTAEQPMATQKLGKSDRLSLREHNIYFRDTEGNERALTTDGTAEDGYRRFIPSPDGRYAISLRIAEVQRHEIHMVESSPRDQVQPRLKTLQYLKPGDRVARTRLTLIRLTDGHMTPIDDRNFAEQWSLGEWQWTADSREFRFLFNQRGHQVLRMLGVAAETGAVRTIFEETSRTFINYSGYFYLRHLEQTDQYLWMSERSGWNHLYLIDARDGATRHITQGNWVVRKINRFNYERSEIEFTACGLDADQDPYHLHYCRVDFSTGKMVRLTTGDGTHELRYAPDRKTYIDTYSRVDLPPIHELRNSADGRLIAQFETADAEPLRRAGWRVPERFSALGRDGKTPIYGVICRPSDYQPDRKYPIIELIYAGPHSAFTPKKFSSWLGKLQEYAELGFVMVQIDGQGTAHRGKSFHDVCWRNLVDAGLPDRIAWMKAAAKYDPSMDLTRVGIFGGSAGGQNALAALLTQGDFYRVAAADCGCHDNRMDKIWWNEQWMGYPIGEHYAAQSNVTLAKNLQGKLLLTVGELDTNVDPASTMQVVNALIRADKDFELLVIPGAGHGVGESPYADRRRKDFFVRHLLGVEPRRDAAD